MRDVLEAQLFAVPVVLIVFNRPDTTRPVFERIASIRPTRLLIVADAARSEWQGEVELCEEVRKIVSKVDWPCQVSTNVAAINLGCRNRIVSGIDWAFSLVEEAIILEDDCLPDPSFFPFCQVMLDRYRESNRIAAISGTNLVERFVDTQSSYYFSKLGGNWGWATWKSRWEHYDEHLSGWPALRSAGALSGIFDRPRDIAYWTRIFDMMYERRGPSAWDYQWVYTNLFGNRLVIVPSVNLVANIGFGAGATHTRIANRRLTPKVKAIGFPLTHPDKILVSHDLDRHYQDLYPNGPLRRIARRLVDFVAQISMRLQS